ncbi:MAG: 3D domain-containing protein [Butyricicoccus sp.]|nr:3D domain-containing protein [Butyricicoccus sp.]MBQ8586015.1 3D domain-containing protein [Butyricicoccus sp.]
MIHKRAKTIVRRLATFALCAALGLSTVLAYDAHTTAEALFEVPAAENVGVLSNMTFGLLSSNVETQIDTVNSADAMTAARETVDPPRVFEATPRTVTKSAAFAADASVQKAGKLLGEYRLSFYCPCYTCNGNTHCITKSGTTLTQGRTIAVDSGIIPLGSKVFIEGYGVFIAEDTGSAIRGSRIDICVGSHSQAYALGIDYANVYLLG